MAHGQAMITTADERRQGEREPRLRADQRSRRRTSAPRSTSTSGTKTSLTRSARRWIGALEPWARSTSSTIRARAVSRPDARRAHDERAGRVDRGADDLVARPTWSTGIGSPVSIDSSTAEAPSTTTPSTGTLSPGRTRSRSPGTTVGQLDVLVDAVADAAGRRRLEGDQPPDRAGGPALRAALEPPPEQDEADDDRRAVEVGLRVRARPRARARATASRPRE